MTWNNEVEMVKHKGMLDKLRSAKTKDDLLELSKHISVGLWYGDFNSPNDGFPLRMESSQRRRMWYVGEWSKVLRVEVSKSLIEDSIFSKQIIDTVRNLPKL